MDGLLHQVLRHARFNATTEDEGVDRAPKAVRLAAHPRSPPRDGLGKPLLVDQVEVAANAAQVANGRADRGFQRSVILNDNVGPDRRWLARASR